MQATANTASPAQREAVNGTHLTTNSADIAQPVGNLPQEKPPDVVLKELANTALMIETYAVTENDSEKVNESVKELVDNLDNAVQSGDIELKPVEVYQVIIYLFLK